MKTGEAIEAQGHTWKVGQRIGTGLWGSSWLLRDESGHERVLKVAHQAKNVRSDQPLPDNFDAICAACAREQAEVLNQAQVPFYPTLEATLELDGAPALLLRRYSSLAGRVTTLPLGDLLDLLLQVSRQLEQLHRTGPHGNLRPENILLTEHGAPLLSDVMTPALAKSWEVLTELTVRAPYAPPEAAGAPLPGWDTWAVSAMLYRAASVRADNARAESQAPPVTGLDKLQLATLKDRALARLTDEHANPRFANRAADRLKALLHRGITTEAAPSPPYRFNDASSLSPRLSEVASLVSPRVDTVGRMLLASCAKNGVFEAGDTPRFSITVGTSCEATTHEDIVCGIQILDRDAPGDGRIAVPGARYSVKPSPGGRVRFEFELEDLPPGRYRGNIAFAVKDSGHEPSVSSGEFEVRPAPGYVPPARQDYEESSPITFPGARPEPIPSVELSLSTQDPSIDLPSDLADDAGALPMPIAPSNVGPVPEPIPSQSQAQPTRTAIAEEDPGTALSASPPPKLVALPTPVDAPKPVAPPTPIVAPTPVMAPTPMPAPVAPVPQALPQASPGSWEALPSVDELPSPEPWVPGGRDTSDLPDWGEDLDEQPATTFEQHLRGLLVRARADLQTAALVASVLMLSAILVLVLLLKACT